MKDSSQNYVYARHESQRYIGVRPNEVKHKRIENRNGSSVLRIGNKTYILGKSKSMKKVPYTKPDGYSIMQTPCFIHKSYLEMYFDPLMVPAGAVEYVERMKNCEDILLSIVVTKFLQDTGTMEHGILAMKNSMIIRHLEGGSSKLL